MSLKLAAPPTAPGPENPQGGGRGQNTTTRDPLDRIFEPCEDSDWEVAFRESIRPGTTASPPAPSTTWRGEDTSENTEHHHQHGPQTSWTTNTLDHRDNPPIELNDNAQIFELDLPVIDTIPSGSVAPLWSHTFISNTSPKYPSIPLYMAEGRADPDPDEGIDEPSSPLTSSPMISGPPQASPQIFRQSQASPMIFEQSQASPMIYDQSQTSSTTFEESHASPVADPQPEDFIDSCDILQWVIDDSNITPNVLIANPAAPATITSGSLQNVQPNATTANFITPIKTDEPIEIPTVVASTSRTYALPPPSPLVKSEPEDSGSDWEPIHHPASRKRGRPSRAPGSRAITPHPATAPETTGNMTEDEVSAQKYRRMRDLNNEASRRCRETRKEKQDAAERQLDDLRTRNEQLRRTLDKMEAQAKLMKSKMMTLVAGQPTAFNIMGTLNTITNGETNTNTVASTSTNNNAASANRPPSGAAAGDLPDLDTMWSRM